MFCFYPKNFQLEDILQIIEVMFYFFHLKTKLLET